MNAFAMAVNGHANGASLRIAEAEGQDQMVRERFVLHVPVVFGQVTLDRPRGMKTANISAIAAALSTQYRRSECIAAIAWEKNGSANGAVQKNLRSSTLLKVRGQMDQGPCAVRAASDFVRVTLARRCVTKKAVFCASASGHFRQ
jgi:hypothetical protein